jgi:P-type Ca2+ transporter type 2C
MWRMAKRNALINRLSAVETLGATNIICTDKTGTLTENRMTVKQIAMPSGTVEVTSKGWESEGELINPSGDRILRRALEVAVLCNNATLPESESDGVIGDPMEVALLIAGAKAEIYKQKLLKPLPEVREVAFDTDTKMMATIHKENEHYLVAVKGAPESVISVCSHQETPQGRQEMTEKDRNFWHDRSQEMAQAGLRILALACKTVENAESEAYKQLTFLGIFGLADPPRQDVKNAIKECHQAGIRVIMLTGDLPVTAREIGLAVGLISDRETEVRQGKDLKDPEELSKQERLQLEQVNIFARVSPEQKLNLISLHQNNNSIVAMTGDGVNDAPALKKADIGIAMGHRGTQVAKEAADMVLQDDAFSTIIAAIEQGRAIFSNIRKFTLYLLSGNMGEIIAVGLASLVNAPLPLLPLQILFLNAINDVFPALALGVGEGNSHQMNHPPRKKNEPILDRRHWLAIAGYGMLIALSVLGVFALCLQILKMETERAVTISFLTLAFARLWHVFNMRDQNSPILRNEITQNLYVWGALLLCTGMLLFAVYVPFLAQVLDLVNPGWQGWGLIIGVSLIPLVLGQIGKALRF